MARHFPYALPLALHIRIQAARLRDTGKAQLSVTVVDEAGKAMVWGADNAEPAALHIPIPSQAADWLEEAYNLVLPHVRFPSAGRFTVRITLSPEPPVTRELDVVDLSLEVESLALPEKAQKMRHPRGMRDLAEELQAMLTPEMRRVLRLATTEAQRLGHWHVGTQHLLIALRRVLGRKSGLPRTMLLRDAVEQVDGLHTVTPSFTEMSLTPQAAQLLRDAVDSSKESLTPDGLLRALLGAERGSYLWILEEAQLLANRRPR